MESSITKFYRSATGILCKKIARVYKPEMNSPGISEEWLKGNSRGTLKRYHHSIAPHRKDAMLNRAWRQFNQQIRSSQVQFLGRATKTILLLTLVPGCTQIQSLFQWSEVDLKIQVKDTSAPGIYAVSGKANLPEHTQISVAAVRYLHLDKTDRASAELNPTYAILDYEPAEVKQGQWQTNLNLWQVAANGNYQESWQIEQKKLGLSLQPDADVIFLATLTPIDDLSQLEQELAKRGIRLSRGSVFSNSEGFRYAQVQQTLAVALPTGQTTPNPEDANFGWGPRYIIPQEPQNPTNLELPADRLTNAPPRQEELLR